MPPLLPHNPPPQVGCSGSSPLHPFLIPSAHSRRLVSLPPTFPFLLDPQHDPWVRPKLENRCWLVLQPPVGLRGERSAPKDLCEQRAKEGGCLEPGSLGAGGCMEEGGGGVVLEERLQEHACCAKNTDEHKDPEEQSVNHHGDVLPVLTHLHGRRGKYQPKDPGKQVTNRI